MCDEKNSIKRKNAHCADKSPLQKSIDKDCHFILSLARKILYSSVVVVYFQLSMPIASYNVHMCEATCLFHLENSRRTQPCCLLEYSGIRVQGLCVLCDVHPYGGTGVREVNVTGLAGVIRKAATLFSNTVLYI